MFDDRSKHLFSIILLLVILFTQSLPASATVSGVNYDTGANLASTGSTECFPDKGEWNGREQLKIVTHEDGDQYQPVDDSKTISVNWPMPFEGMGKQIEMGLKYRVNLEVYGQFLDFDQAEVAVEFLQRMEDGRGYRLAHSFKKDVDGWNRIFYEGYVPVGAEGMLLRLKSHQYSGDAAIYFRNISVVLIDDTVPVVEGVLYNFRYDLKEKASFKDYYGLGDKVTMDVVFSEPVFANDAGYLAYARGMDDYGRAQLGDRIAREYPYETGALSDIRSNNGRDPAQQFGSLSMRFTYKNSDGSIKTGIADFVDRTLLKTDPSPDQLNRLKFIYTVRNGDEFKAEDIMDMQLVGGVITDNACNRLPDSQRKLSSRPISGQKSSAASDDPARGGIYHQYTQNFSVETSPPVLLSINGNLPEGNVDGLLRICLNYSEPVYVISPDRSKVPEGYEANPCLLMNGRYAVQAEGKSLGNEAYYWGGDGTSQLQFTYSLDQDYASMERIFDPLEVVDSLMLLQTSQQRYEYGQPYIADAAGNTAPLFPKEDPQTAGMAVKLSDNKYYTNDRVPPEIHISARKTENGYSVKVDVTEDGSGLNDDEVKFGITEGRFDFGFYPFIPGKEYSAKELASLFNLKDTGWGTWFINASAEDNAGNYAHDSIEVARANFDIQPAQIDNVTDQGYGNYTISITDNGFREGVASVRQKWVSSGTDPDLIEWIGVKSFDPWVSDKVEINPPQAPYIWKKADLYIEAVDRAGNRSVFSIPDAYRKPEDGALRVTWSLADQNRYIISVRYNSKGDGYEFPPGVWFCMTQQPEMPSPHDSAWLYKAGGTIDTLTDPGMNGDTTPGLWYLHVRAADRDGRILAAQTVSHLFSFDSAKPEIHIHEKREGNQWQFQVTATDNDTLPEDIKIHYQVNFGERKPLDNGGTITVEPGKERSFTLTITAGDRNQNQQKFDHTYHYDMATEEGKLPQPYVCADYGPWNSAFGSVCNQTAYTRDDFAQLEVITSGNEFSYSIDGVNWSNWLPLTSKDTFSHMEMNRYYELVNSMGYKAYAAYVPLPDKEGTITFRTRYRKGTRLISDPIETTIVRDVTPPTASVEFTDTTFTTTAKLTVLSDNLSPREAITMLGESEAEFRSPGSHTFVIRDAAGNRAEIKAAVTEVGLPPSPVQDTTAPVITITDTAEGAIVGQVSATITATDSSSFTLKYAWSQDNNYGNIAAEDWSALSNGSTINLTCASGQDGIWHLYVRATDSEGNSRVESMEYTLDVTAPVVSFRPDGSAAEIALAEVNASAEDQYVVDAWYVWSQNENPPELNSGEWIALNRDYRNQFRVSLEAVDGPWILHFKAVDPSGNVCVESSNPFHMTNGSPPPDTSAPVITLGGTPANSIVQQVSAMVNAADSSAVTLKIAWSSNSEAAEIPAEAWQTIASGSTSILENVTDGIWYLHVSATDAYGNAATAQRSYEIDATDPTVTITPDGSFGKLFSRASPEVTVIEPHIKELSYVWSQDGTAPDSGWLDLPETGIAGELLEAGGIWFLYVKAVDQADNTAVFKSEEFMMVESYTTPRIVYSGEEEGDMTAYIVSAHELTVTGAVYCVLPYDSVVLPATHVFQYTYPDGATGTVTAVHAYPDRAENWELEYKANVQIAPSDTTTTGAVDVILEVPEDDESDYTIEIQDEDDEDDLYEYFSGEGSNNVLILKGSIIDRNTGTALREITEDNPELLSSIELGDDEFLRIMKVRLATSVNGNLYYNVGDGNFLVRIGHIVEELEQGKVTVAASHRSPARHFVTASGYFPALSFSDELLLAANTKTVTGSAKPKAQLTYTFSGSNQKSVTVKIEFADSGMTIQNNGGENTRRFTENGQFVFEYGKEGFCWRSLAQVSSFSTPEVDISYSRLLPTNQPVRVTMAPSDGSTLVSGDVQPRLENGVYWFDTSENGQFSFIFENPAGNRATITPIVENIDKTPPVLCVDYITDYGSGTVKAVLKSDEALRIPEGKSVEHTFGQNGEYVFSAEDVAGNQADIAATVTSLPFPDFLSGIDVQVKYSTTLPARPPVTLTLVSEEPFTVVNTYGKTSVRVNKNGTYRFIVRDAYGLYKLVEARVANITEEAAAEESGPVVLVNGIEAGTEPIELEADRLIITTLGFLGEVTVKWAQGYRAAAYFKGGGETAAGGAVPVSGRGWITLQIYDNERNIRLVHVLASKVGGAKP